MNQRVASIMGRAPKPRPVVGQKCVCLEPKASFSLIPCTVRIYVYFKAKVSLARDWVEPPMLATCDDKEGSW